MATVWLLVVIIAMATALSVALAKRKGRKFRPYIRGMVDEGLTLGTLAATTLVSAAFDEVVDEKAWLSSIVARYTMNGLNPAENQGPILVGLAHSDYTDAEIEEWLENTGSWTQGDLVQRREVGKRLIKQVGIFPSRAAGQTVVLNDGKPIKTKCGWMLASGQTVKFWAFNLGSAALDTTVADVFCEGHANIWPA